MSEVILISSRQKGERIFYQIEKQGIIFLRALKNKKFRVIFNISHLNLSNDPFNILLLGERQKYQQQQKGELKQQDSQIFQSKLTISTVYKQLSEDRVIIALNAYLNPQWNEQYLAVFGYLIASSIFYHNFDKKLTDRSFMTILLANFGKILDKTDIDQLNENIKFETGFEKHPYFLCLFMKDQQIIQEQGTLRSHFNQFYRSEPKQQSQVNAALSTLIDYFPQRSALGIQTNFEKSSKIKELSFRQAGIKKIRQLAEQFEKTIVGRQLFNFQFTGASIQNLSFQMCQYFNRGQNINLMHIYGKIILNQKSRVLDESVSLYMKQISEKLFQNTKVDFDSLVSTNSILPISESQLLMKFEEMKMVVITESQKQALNCMNLGEYLEMSNMLKGKILDYQNKLRQLNVQKGLEFANECFQLLENIQLPNQEENTGLCNLNSEQIGYQFSNIQNKIQLFSIECLGLFTQLDKSATIYNSTFLRLISGFMEKLRLYIQNNIKAIEFQSRSNKLEIDTLKYEVKKVKTQKKKIQNQFQMQCMIIDQYKAKVAQLIANGGANLQLKKQAKPQTVDAMCIEFYSMKKKIEQLQEEVKDKNLHIDELSDILDKFQNNKGSLFQKQEFKFSKQINELVQKVGQKLNSFYTLLDQVKNVEKSYESTKKLLALEREKIIEQKIKDQKELNQKLSQFQKVSKEKQMLEQIIIEEKMAIQNLKDVQHQLKDAVDQLQNINGQLTCLRAQTQTQLELYRKATKLTVQQQLKGKSEALSKFFKFLEDQDLKSILKPIIKK